MKKILVIGYYHRKDLTDPRNVGNIGDTLFSEAFANLFPEFQFTFNTFIKMNELKEADALWIGGGSFLKDDLYGEEGFQDLLKTKDVYYIGVGTETVGEQHHELMKRAKLLAIRSEKDVEKYKKWNQNVILIPDLVYSLSDKIKMAPGRKDKSVLILPNIDTIPQNTSPHWKHSAWDYFKSEFSMFLDILQNDGYTVNFGAMCENTIYSDTAASFEIINQMDKRKYKNMLPALPQDFEGMTTLISSYGIVFSARLHGCIIADMTHTPFVSLAHHDKLKKVNGLVLPYYELNKAKLFDAMNRASSFPREAIDISRFDLLKKLVVEKMN